MAAFRPMSSFSHEQAVWALHGSYTEQVPHDMGGCALELTLRS